MGYGYRRTGSDWGALFATGFILISVLLSTIVSFGIIYLICAALWKYIQS